MIVAGRSARILKKNVAAMEEQTVGQKDRVTNLSMNSPNVEGDGSVLVLCNAVHTLQSCPQRHALELREANRQICGTEQPLPHSS